MPLVARTGKTSQSVFPTAFDLLCFSASLGYSKSITGSISAGSKDRTEGGEVVMNVPDRKDRLLCDMIAVAHMKSDKILEAGELQKRLDVFMEYACGGMDYLLTLMETRTARDAVETIIRGTDGDDSVQELDEFVSLGDQIDVE